MSRSALGVVLPALLRVVLENVAVFVLATFVIFWIINQAPGNPIDIWHPEPGLSDQERDTIAAELGLDQPLPVRYAHLLWRTLRLDLGVHDGIPVRERLLHGAETTVLLTAGAVLVSVLLGVSLGVAAGLERGGWPVRLFSGGLYVLSLFPVFLLCYAVHLIFLELLGVLPIFEAVEAKGGIWKLATALAMVSVLGIGDGTVTEILRSVRTEVQRISSSRFMRAVRANGASVGRHLARNVIVPVATVVNLRLLYFLGGAVVVEFIFQLDGLGWLTWQSIDTRNYELVFAVAVLSVIAVVTINLVNAVLIGLVDPRTRS